jgi:hypothetical protein
MLFPVEGGLTAVRRNLAVRGDEMERFALERLAAEGRTAGRLVCICRTENRWTVGVSPDATHATARCENSGSTLQIYVGTPPFRRRRRRRASPSVEEARQAPDCPLCGESPAGELVVGVGYPGPVPELGTLEVERAVELVLASRCPACDVSWIRWRFRLNRPPFFTGRESWLPPRIFPRP